ncbi:cytochrome d ubiquinol oxidase subunit II [Klebsiella pneumoniae subsp. pneumoniae]|nr:cytochrome d ubiquinol oxidase subunit II [Klebsiella pneumoniae subsp. pneumoniae]
MVSDLGIGMLFSVVHDGEERDVMVNSVAPSGMVTKPGWCSAGQGCSGAFPLAYAWVITDALVIPLTAMLIGLIFRGVAFEFRFQAVPSHRIFWDYALCRRLAVGDLQPGVVVGAFINGFAVADRRSPVRRWTGLPLSICSAVWGWWWLYRCWAPRGLIMKAKARCSSGCAS